MLKRQKWRREAGFSKKEMWEHPPRCPPPWPTHHLKSEERKWVRHVTYGRWDHKRVSTQQAGVGVKYLAAGLLGVRYEHVNCLPLCGSRFMRSRLPGGPRETLTPSPYQSNAAKSNSLYKRLIRVCESELCGIKRCWFSKQFSQTVGELSTIKSDSYHSLPLRVRVRVSA